MRGTKRLASLISVIVALLTVATCAGSASRAEMPQVVAAVAHDLYPEYLVDTAGQPGGFAIEMMDALAKRAGLSVTYHVFQTWTELVAALERGDADVVPVLSVTPAREGRMMFTRPVLTSPVSLFVQHDSDIVRGWGDLAGRRVGVIASGVSGQLLAARNQSAIIVPYGRLQDALFGLLSGEVDALVSFQSSVWKVADRARVADLIKIVGDPFSEVKRAVAVRQDLPDLRDRLDKSLPEFLSSSEYREVYSKWYSAQPSFWNFGRMGWLSGAFTALLLLGMLIWQSLSPRPESRRAVAGTWASSGGVIPQACGLIAIALGTAVLLGWTFEVLTLKSVLPGLFAMQPWAAVTIALAGGALLAATAKGWIARLISKILAAAVFIIGLQALLQYVTGLDFGTDRWLFPTAVSNQPRHPHPGRVAEVTSIAFMLMGTMLPLARSDRAWAGRALSIIGTIGLLLMTAPLVGYLLGAGTLRSVAFLTPIALHAALGLVVVFVGALALRQDTGWTALLSGDRPGAASARMLLPIVVAGPLSLAWLFDSGKQAGFYGPEFETGLITLATMTLLAASLLWNAARLDRLDQARRTGAKALHASEERYRTLVEGQPDPICQFLPDTTLTFVNQAYADFYGRTPEELIGKRWLDFAGEEDRPRFLDELASFSPENPERHEETRSSRADGEVRWLLCHLHAFFDESGKVASFQTFGTDITSRKRAVDALHESEARYRTAGEAVRYGVWVCDSDGGVEFVSQIFLDLVGKTLEEVRPRGWLDRLPPEDLKATLDAWRECVRTGGEWSWEHRVKGKDGIYRTILSLGRPVRDDNGRISSWVGFNLDISERKQAEEALARHVGLLTAITDSAADAIFVSDDRGRVTLMNPAAERIFGWSRRELTGQILHNAIHDHHPDGRPYPASECALRRVYETGETLLRHEDVFFRKDGSQVQVACSNAPLMIEGRIAGSVLVAHDITERKRSEQALRESEARLRRTVEYAPFPIMVHAEDGEVVHISQAWLALTGYSREEIATVAAWTERAYGDRKEMVRAGIGQLYRLQRATEEGEYLIRTADGGTRVWAFSSAPLGTDGRGRRLVVSMAADVTERKEAERALSESEIRVRALLDASQDEILLLSADGMVLAINKAAQRRLAKRMGGADPVGAHLDRLLPRDQVESRMTIVRQVASTALLEHCEVQVRARWFDFWFYPVSQPDRPISEVAVYAREITEQKQSQAELNKLFQAIHQSPMSVVITDRHGAIEYVNPEFTKVTGYTAQEAIGQNPRILKSGHTPVEHYAELWNAISAGGVWRGELLNKKKSGELFWELASVAPVKEGDRITSFVAVKEDITHRKEMEDQLRQSQKMEALGQLTGGIAHDFNNLLAIIIGNLQLLEERLKDNPKLHDMLQDATWSARRAGELTRRLLAFARRQPLKPDIIDLNEVIGNMSELLRRTLGAGIRIEESLAPDLWRSFADRGELERALVNLAVNSRDAMRGGGTLTLETRNALLDESYAEQYEEVRPGQYVLVAVTDTGTGMPPHVVQRAFEPFFTTKQVGQGSGLGLSMVYGFVKQSGGHISIYSRMGQGTCVKIYLPRASAPPEGIVESCSDASAEELRKKVVLVVEDEPKLRKIAVRMLDRLGLRSMQAETAKNALEFLAEEHIDILFTDVELPGGMNGAELANIAHRLYPELKVLFTTGYAREAILHERGVHEHAPWLLKPYSHKELARELKALFVPALH